MKRRHLLLARSRLLAACAAPDVRDYAREQPALDLRAYFNGRVDGYGIFTDRNGKVVRRFTVVVDGSWRGDEGVLDEDFTYSDGTSSAASGAARPAGGRFAGPGRRRGRRGRRTGERQQPALELHARAAGGRPHLARADGRLDAPGGPATCC
jgi:hypothetical protein